MSLDTITQQLAVGDRDRFVFAVRTATAAGVARIGAVRAALEQLALLHRDRQRTYNQQAQYADSGQARSRDEADAALAGNLADRYGVLAQGALGEELARP